MIKQCEYDGKEFNAAKSKIRFCSRNCANAYKTKERKQLICKQCGKIFLQKVPLRIDVYCSKECQLEAIAKKEKLCEREGCGKLFLPAHKSTRYCSLECAGLAKTKPKISGICEKCGKHYTTKYTTTAWVYSKHQTRRYCSKECQLAALRKDKIKTNCLVCNKEMELYPSQVKDGHHKTCSRKCYHEWNSADHHYNWKGGTTLKADKVRKSPAYNAWRVAVFIRDNKTCVQCDRHYRNGRVLIEADHIRPRSLFPEHTLNIENGRTLCRECHIMTPTSAQSKFNPPLTREDFMPNGRLYDYVLEAQRQIGLSKDPLV